MSEQPTQQPTREAGEIKFSYGGQAVIEGVLMRGAHTAAIAVRNPEGEIVVHEQDLNQTLYRGWIARTPFMRGVVGLWDALGLGTRALMWAADVALGDEEDVSFNGPIGFATVAFSLILGIGLFFLLPTTAATGVGSLLGITSSSPDAIVEEGEAVPDLTQETESSSFIFYEALPIGWEATVINFIEAVIQLGILIVYISLIGRLEDVKRLFGYHGAEHKTINAYEAGDELTPEIVAQYPIEHPRCGTAFLLTVVFVSVLVFSLLGRPPFFWLIVSRIVLIPVIAGIAYEALKWSAANLHRPWVAFIVKPNLALQHLTTREPDLHMIEVAIVSFKRVLLSEGLIDESEAQIPEPNPDATAQAAGVTLSK
jgi:uncharacterized protein YqhQ